ncbi:MAG: ferric reductase-like transmembrane domain-containing protein, partial [Opitutales bacterium]
TQGIAPGESDEAFLEDEIMVGANLNETLTESTGNIAISFFLIVLCLTPLRRLFPHALLVSALNRHSRLLGLACFFYACLHFTLYFDDGLQRLFNEWKTILYVQAGLAAFSVLLVMAITSNDWAVRKMGKHRWKKLHRLVYLLVPILFYHKGWAGKGGLDSGDEQVIEALIWFSPLFALQLVRIFLYFRKRNSVPAAVGGA